MDVAENTKAQETRELHLDYTISKPQSVEGCRAKAWLCSTSTARKGVEETLAANKLQRDNSLSLNGHF